MSEGGSDWCQGPWYLIMLQHQLVIALSQVSVNHDGRGGTAPDPLVWALGEQGQATFKLFISGFMLDLARLPRPAGFLDGHWVQVDGGLTTSGSDVAAWP